MTPRHANTVVLTGDYNGEAFYILNHARPDKRSSTTRYHDASRLDMVTAQAIINDGVGRCFPPGSLRMIE